MELFSV